MSSRGLICPGVPERSWAATAEVVCLQVTPAMRKRVASPCACTKRASLCPMLTLRAATARRGSRPGHTARG